MHWIAAALLTASMASAEPPEVRSPAEDEPSSNESATLEAPRVEEKPSSGDSPESPKSEGVVAGDEIRGEDPAPPSEAPKTTPSATLDLDPDSETTALESDLLDEEVGYEPDDLITADP